MPTQPHHAIGDNRRTLATAVRGFGGSRAAIVLTTVALMLGVAQHVLAAMQPVPPPVPPTAPTQPPPPSPDKPGSTPAIPAILATPAKPTTPADADRTKQILEKLVAMHSDTTLFKTALDKYATTAETEQLSGVASLMRAMARSMQVNLELSAEAIAKAGGAIKVETDATVIAKKFPIAAGANATSANLDVAMNTLKTWRETDLPALTSLAVSGKNRDLQTLVRYARESATEHGRFAREAHDTLAKWKTKRDFFVSRKCGYTVDKLDLERCPVCRAGRDNFERIN